MWAVNGEDQAHTKFKAVAFSADIRCVEEPRLFISLAVSWVLISLMIRRVGFPLGESFAIGLALLLPILNVLAVVFLISREFPVEKEARALRRELGRPLPQDAKGYLREARYLAGNGQFADAEAVYEEVRRVFPGTRSCEEAEKAIEEIRQWRRENPQAA